MKIKLTECQAAEIMATQHDRFGDHTGRIGRDNVLTFKDAIEIEIVTRFVRADFDPDTGIAATGAVRRSMLGLAAKLETLRK